MTDREGVTEPPDDLEPGQDDLAEDLDDALDEALDDQADEEFGGGIGSVRGKRNITISDPRGAVQIVELLQLQLQSEAGLRGHPDWCPRTS